MIFLTKAYGDLVARAASLNLEIHDEMRPIFSQLYELEAQVGSALRKMSSERPRAQKMLRKFKSDAAILRDALLPQLHRIMALAEAS